MERFFFNQDLLPLARDKSTFLFHPHTARTGGRTFREKVLSQVYGAERVYCRQHVPDVKPWKILTGADLRDFNAYTDLTNFVPLHLSRPLVGVALLRDPLYRAVSLYWFIRRKKDHRHYAHAQQYGLEDFYHVAPADNPVYFNNVQCRRICGTPDAAQALASLPTHYIAAGFTNHLADFTRELSAAFGWPALELETKTADNSRYDAQITPSFRKLILSQNAHDRAMYDAVVAGRVPEARHELVSAIQSLPAHAKELAARARRKLTRVLAPK